MKMAILQNIETRKYDVLLLKDDVVNHVRVLSSFRTFNDAMKWIEPLHVYDHVPEED